jgi:hypothetical protein
LKAASSAEEGTHELRHGGLVLRRRHSGESALVSFVSPRLPSVPSSWQKSTRKTQGPVIKTRPTIVKREREAQQKQQVLVAAQLRMGPFARIDNVADRKGPPPSTPNKN